MSEDLNFIEIEAKFQTKIGLRFIFGSFFSRFREKCQIFIILHLFSTLKSEFEIFYNNNAVN